VPSLLDTSGNNDEIICGKPLTPEEQAARFANARVPVIFDFTDNHVDPGSP
jgi:hypothetical protein